MGGYMFLGHSPISWKSKKQPTVSKSFTKAEYWSLSSTNSEIVWLRQLLRQFGVSLVKPTVVYVDNTGAINIATNPVFHEWKHIEIDCHFIRQHVDFDVIRLPRLHSTSIWYLYQGTTHEPSWLPHYQIDASCIFASIWGGV